MREGAAKGGKRGLLLTPPLVPCSCPSHLTSNDTTPLPPPTDPAAAAAAVVAVVTGPGAQRPCMTSAASAAVGPEAAGRDARAKCRRRRPSAPSSTFPPLLRPPEHRNRCRIRPAASAAVSSPTLLPAAAALRPYLHTPSPTTNVRRRARGWDWERLGKAR